MKTAVEMKAFAYQLFNDHINPNNNLEFMGLLEAIEQRVVAANGDISEVRFDGLDLQNPLTKGHFEDLGYKVTVFEGDYDKNEVSYVTIKFG